MNIASTKQWPQYLAAITATIALAGTGSHIGWTSPTLPLLKGPNSPLPITSDEASWTASIYLLGAFAGNILAAILVDYFGRKRSLILAVTPLLLSWILILFAWNPYVLYGARIMSGMAQGIIYVVCPMYIGEIADKDIRGALGSLIKLMVTFGEFYSHTVGPFVSYDCLVYACAAIPVLFFLSFSWMPESPYYLLMRNDQKAAERSLMRLKGCKSKENIESDVELMQKLVVRDLTNKATLRDLFDSPGVRKAVLVSIGLQAILQLSGLGAIEAYTQEIFEESGSGLSSGLAVIILSILQLVAGVAAIALVDRLGRRPLLLSSTLISALSLTVSSVFYLLKLRYNFNTNGYGWILDSSIMLYQMVVALGLSPVSYMMLGELFPTNVKGIAVSVANVTSSLFAFLIAKFYQIVTDAYGIHTSLACFAMVCYVGIPFLYFIVPETRGKSLIEIQESLCCDKKRKDKINKFDMA